MVSFQIDNNGFDSLDHVTAYASIPELGISSSRGPFKLGEGRQEDRRIFIELPEDVEPGTYLLRFSVGEGKYSRTVYRDIEIQ